MRAGNLGQLLAQPADDLVGAEFPLFQRLERDEHAAGVGGPPPAAAAGEGDHAVDGRILADDRRRTVQQLFHRLERSVLVGLDRCRSGGRCPAAGRIPWERSTYR